MQQIILVLSLLISVGLHGQRDSIGTRLDLKMIYDGTTYKPDNDSVFIWSGKEWIYIGHESDFRSTIEESSRPKNPAIGQWYVNRKKSKWTDASKATRLVDFVVKKRDTTNDARLVTHGNGVKLGGRVHVVETSIQGNDSLNNITLWGEWGVGDKVVNTAVYDTVKCIMLVSDTALFNVPIIILKIRGYEVRQIDSVEQYYDPNGPAVSGGRTLLGGWFEMIPTYTHIQYLDADKKPLKYFVWQSQTIK